MHTMSIVRPLAAPTIMRLRARTPADDDIKGTRLVEVVDLVLPYLPDGLVGVKSSARIRTAVRSVPAELVARFALECRLDTGADDADVLVNADSETGGMQMLAGRHPLVKLPASLADSERWAPTVRLCQRRQPGFLLHRATRDVWVDLTRQDEPSLGFGLRLAGLPEAPRRPVEVLIRALELGLHALRDEPLQPPTLPSLRALVRRLPESTRVDSAGVVVGSHDGVRLWLTRLGADALVDLVDATRDGNEAKRIREVLDDIAAPAASMRPRLDVNEGVGRSVGLVCAADLDGSPAQVATRWRPLLNRLVDAGLCGEDKREALVAGWGLLREGQSERWPEHLKALSTMLGDDTESVLRWRLQHVTIECDRGEPVRATAHVGVWHDWSHR